jgi:hypothetical protein
MAERLAFIDHSYHETSRASDFLVELLGRDRPVDLFRDDSWRGGAAVDLASLAARGYRRYLFFQVTKFRARDLEALKGCTVTVVPMYDDFPFLRHRPWRRLRASARLRFVSFSRTLHERLIGQGFASLPVRYWPNLDDLPETGGDPGGLRGFFWQRTKWITWKQVRRLVGDAAFTSFCLHTAVDPGFSLVSPPPEDVERFGIRETGWFDEREAYYRELARATVFFAPRRSEGIGMSFLEAMAMGLCVVAHDGPTMNEYIEHGANGLLYNARRPAPLDFSTAADLGREARRQARQGRGEWLTGLPRLAEWIEG